MNKRLLLKLTGVLLLVSTIHLSSCSDDKSNSEPPSSSTTNDVFKDAIVNNVVVIDQLPLGISTSELKILSLNEECPIDNSGNASSTTYTGEFPQIMMLTDANDNLLMMSRDEIINGQKNEISARSTAIALVTLHPALSGAKSHVYKELANLITECSSFPELESAIEEAIKNGRSFADSNNNRIINALNTVFEQVVSNSSIETGNDGELPSEDDLVENTTLSRASELKGVTTIAGINVGPFHVTTAGSNIIVENYSLTPFYSGTVTYGSKTNIFNIPSGGDRGITFFFDQSWGSSTVKYCLTNEGSYQFSFDKTTAESYLDQAAHTVCNVLEALGLPLSQKWIMATADDIVRFMASRGMDLVGLITNPNTEAWDVTLFVANGIADYIKDGAFAQMLLKTGIKSGAAEMAQAVLKKMVAVYSLYQMCRGTINAVMRITMRLQSPDNVNFCVYYYQGEITTCTSASIEKASGDNQTGLIGRRLMNPIRVKVTTTGDDGSIVESSNFHRVKFEPEDINCGTVIDEMTHTDNDGYAQTYWILDPVNTEPQYVTATVIDIVTGEEISDPVTFVATPTETANVTFTLDWSPTDPHCDIDLHIIDPEGHHIYYADKRCSCGGYLDRDDRQGPGPEHIYFHDAKPGKYRIYVHHFNSDARGTVGFRVSTDYEERHYENYGSVAYHQQQYIATLDVSGNSRSRNVEFLFEENAPSLPKILPTK